MEFDETKYTDYYITRKRYIPNETIRLKGDVIHYLSEDMMVTSWKTLRQRSDFAGGISVYYFKEGWKISLVLKQDLSIYHWYIDIMDTTVNKNHINTVDMLLDVVIERDGSIQVLDCDELADVTDSGLVSPAFCSLALRRIDKLLRKIYHGEHDELLAPARALYKKLYPDAPDVDNEILVGKDSIIHL